MLNLLFVVLVVLLVLFCVSRSPLVHLRRFAKSRVTRARQGGPHVTSHPTHKQRTLSANWGCSVLFIKKFLFSLPGNSFWLNRDHIDGENSLESFTNADI